MHTTARRLRVERMGRIAYAPMLALQEARHAEVLAGQADDTLFLLEHEPVITLGRNSQEGHVLASAELLRQRGVELHESGRGGDVTYHGPGQIVGYPIVHLQPGERDVRGYVYKLEEVLIRTAADFGVSAKRVDGRRGIWVGNSKLAAIGVRIARWATLHGFAFNVCTRLEDFNLIVPCGLHGCGVTSLHKLLHAPPTLHEVQNRLALHAATILERRIYSAQPTAAPRSAATSPPQRAEDHGEVAWA